MHIYLAHKTDTDRRDIEACLQQLGHSVDLSTADPKQLLQRCQDSPPEIAIVAASFAEDRKFHVANDLAKLKACPLIAIVERSDLLDCQQMIQNNLYGILVHTLNADAWRPALYLAKLRFEQLKSMEAKLKGLETALDQLGSNHEAVDDHI